MEHLAAHSAAELLEQAVGLVARYNAEHPKPTISPRHSFWELPHAAQAARTATEVTPSAASENILIGFTVQSNFADDVVQIFFDDKRLEDMRNALKAAGWH